MLATSWYFIFYLFSVLDRLGGMFIGLTILFCLASVFLLMMHSDVYDDELKPKFVRYIKTSIALFFTFLVIAVIIPDKKDMLLIVAGGSVGEFVSNNEDAKAIPSEVTKWLRAELKSATAELNPAAQARKAALEDLDKEELVKRLLAAKDSIK